METNFLQVSSNSIGGYLSSEQIDFLTIIQCKSLEELIGFVEKCDQINQKVGLISKIQTMDLETAKRFIFETYQGTMVFHCHSKKDSRMRRLEYLGVTPEQMDAVSTRNPVEMLRSYNSSIALGGGLGGKVIYHWHNYLFLSVYP